MITRANIFYKRQIAKLWVKAFGGSKKNVYEFYEKVCPVKNTFVDVVGLKVVSMATVIPVKSGELKGGYIYAVATKEEFRNQGRCGKILNYISRKTDFDFTFLKPSEESLFDFYARYGYTKHLYIPDYKNITAEGFEECSAKEYFYLRAKHLENYIEWNRDVIEYILSYAKAYKKGEEICITDGDRVLEYLGKDLKKTVKFAALRGNFDTKDLYFNLAIE